MQARSVRLTSKRLYIADLARRIEAMDSGRSATTAAAYRLFSRRLKAAIAAYPVGLLVSELGAAHPAVLHAVEQQEFEAEGMMSGRGSARALLEATTLLRRLRQPTS